MEAIITKILGLAKYTNKFFVVVAVGTAILLFSPNIYLEKLGLVQMIIEHKQYIGISFLVSTVVVVTNFIVFFHHKVNKFIKSKRILRKRQERLHRLNAFEKRILRYYFERGTNTQELSINDGTVAELRSWGIIQRASNICIGFAAPYNLNPWAREYLTENLDLLELSEEEIQIIRKEMSRSIW